MSEFFFGLGKGRVSERTVEVVQKIARKHGCDFVANYCEPGSGPRYWFCGPNRGFPFDDAMAKAVSQDLAAAGFDMRDLA